ncbi:TetR/AcrR family transcriptional regulator [Ramlibacter sp. XY19]|uniref:TetR/AcrR family transcriptional regulator n=1 Tax=Ramlibacter paludis TaxID=2908000 RepID=UPI0023DAB7E6|nr:TetR/AcrR family transcriptional regulator [Ramlibacter paludis]MCG2591173.1 TetR/AcrR family transcriptional regulator [Ramlibacter paludis]
MKTETPRAPARQNRERVLAAIREAAIAEFSQNGLKGTSTQAIAERAGLTKPQLHYYIEGKEELYEELLMSVVADWKGIFDAASTDPAQVLGDYIASKIRLAFDKPEISRIFTREVLDGGPYLEQFWPDSRKNTREKVAVINGWIARGLMQPVDAHTLLFSIWAMTQFYADSALQVQQLKKPNQPGWMPEREKLVAELTAFVLRGCGIK